MPIASNFNSRAGLPANAVYSMVQNQGYLWLGTEKGLVRFDGKNFKSFNSSDLNENSVSDLRIDSKGMLRCQNFSGKHFYLFSDSLFIDTAIAMTGNYAPVLEEPNGTTYHLSFNTVQKRKNDKIEVQKFQHQVFALFHFQNSVYTFDSSGLFPLNRNDAKRKFPFQLKGETVFFAVNFQGKLLIFPRANTYKTAYCFLPSFEKISVDLPEVFIQSVNVAYDSLIFVATNNGLFVLDRQFKQLKITQPLLNNKNVSGILCDTEGALWVSTLDNGIYRFDCFQCLTNETSEPVKTLAILPSGKQVLCGTSSGKVYQWSYNQSFQKIYECRKRQPITALYRTKDETLFIGGDFFIIKPKNAPATEVHQAVKKIVPIEPNKLALGRTGGVSILSAIEENHDTTFTKYFLKNQFWVIKDWHIINNGNLRVRSVAFDSMNKKIYAATSLGLLQLNQTSWGLVKYNHQALQANDIAIRNDTLFAVINHKLFLIKNGKVLLEKKVANSFIKHIRVSEGNAFLSYGSTIQELSHSLAKKATYELTSGNEINDFCIANNNLVMATDAGVTSVATAFLLPRKQPLKLFVEHFSANGNLLDIKQHHDLPHTSNNLKLIFSVPFFGKPEALSIQYKVNNDSWQIMEKGLRELNLISLVPGNYHIRFRAMADEGRSSSIENIFFTIRPPFWKSWWFYVLSLSGVAGTAFVLYRYRVHLIKKQNDLEKQTITLENKLRESILASVKAQMNPHFIFNALNTIQSFIYLNDKQQATEYLGKFSQLTRTILDMSSKNSVSLGEEIAAILLYLDLEKVRFEETMDYCIEVSPNLNPSLIRIPSLIIQPYVENAVKHGLLHKKGERWVKLCFEKQLGMLKVAIDDNGVGRERSAALNKIKGKQHQSFATQANEKRLDALNRGNAGAVSVRYIDKVSVYGEPQGTTVVLLIAILDE